MNFLPDTNCCIEFLRGRNQELVTRWRAIKANEIFLCSVVVYELRHGAERSSNPASEHSKLNAFLAPYLSLPFDDFCAMKCAEIRAQLERTGTRIGPHDLQIAAIALHHGITLISHNTAEFARIPSLKLDDWEK